MSGSDAKNAGPSTTTGEVPGIGSVLEGKYRLDRLLGAGGMGVVYAAWHLSLDEPVAIKLLNSERNSSPKSVERLLREARATVKVKSEHVVRVHDVGILADGQPFIVMEYLEGEDLGAFLERTGPLPVEMAVDFVLEACEAVAEAHAHGIVHRDLKPANLFLQRRGAKTYVKVLDFGISRMLESSYTAITALTSLQTVVGSPAYASPEQLVTPERVDTRADIWALGVITYEFLCGNRPFVASTFPLLCTRILQEPPPSMTTFRSGLPSGIERVITTALEKDPQHRCQTVVDFARTLGKFGSSRGRASVEVIEAIPVPAHLLWSESSSSSDRSATVSTSNTVTSADLDAAGRRVLGPRRIGPMLFGLVAAVFLSVLVWGLTRGGRRGENIVAPRSAQIGSDDGSGLVRVEQDAVTTTVPEVGTVVVLVPPAVSSLLLPTVPSSRLPRTRKQRPVSHSQERGQARVESDDEDVFKTRK